MAGKIKIPRLRRNLILDLAGTRRKLAHVILLACFLELVLMITACGGPTTPSASEPSLSSIPIPVDAESDLPLVEIPLKDHLRFQHLTTADGLSEGRVWDILQDRQGFMWFTTWDGLNRYDGYKFKVYKEEHDNPNSPGGEGFWAVEEDQDGMIWAGSHTGGGLSRFDPTTEQWQRYQNDPDDPHSLSSNTVYDVYEDRMGVLWVGTGGGGLNRFDGEMEGGSARFTRYQHDPDDPQSLGNNVVYDVYEDRMGVLWVATNGGGLNRFDRESGIFIRYQYDRDDPISLGDNHAFNIFEDGSGVLWIGTDGGGLNRFDRESETFTRYQHDPDDPRSLSNDTVSDILEDRSGVLWVSTFGGGLNRYHPESDNFTSYQSDPTDVYSLGSNNLTNLFQDQSGVIWIGIAAGGIDKINPFNQAFTSLRHKHFDSNSLSNDDVRAVVEDRFGDWWIATWGGGLNHYNPETEIFTQYFNNAGDPTSLGDDSVWSIFEDHDGVIWIGPEGGGLSRLDGSTGDGQPARFTRIKHDLTNPQSLSNNDVTVLYEDSSGILWVGTWTGGLNALERGPEGENTRFKRYQHNPQDSKSLGEGSVWAINEDSAGELWVGTGGGGLCRFDRQTEAFACYVHEPDNEHSLSNNTVWAIHPDEDGSLWLGTSGGLNRFSPQTGQFRHYSTADGLPHNTVVGILETASPSGNVRRDLWLSTLNGLSHFDPDLETFRNYDTSDGLPGNIFNLAAFRTSSGRMLFGSQQGLTAFYPEDIKVNRNIPPVRITSFTLSNEPALPGDDSILQRSIVDTKKLELNYDDRIISFEFAALDYASPENNRYRYMLEGFDETWVEIGSDRRFVTYTNLDPGEYVFRVIGSNNDDIWNEEGASIEITISPPWWETTWFRIGLGVLVIGLLAAGYSWRVRSLQARTHELEAQIDALFENSPVGIALTNFNGEVLTTNKGLLTILRVSEDELKRKGIRFFYANPADRETFLAEVQKSGSVHNFGIQLRRIDGELFQANMSIGRVFLEGEEVLLTLVDDITEEINAENQVAIFEERVRIARDLHDSVTQTLYSARMIAESTPSILNKNPTLGKQNLVMLSEMIGGALAEMRSLLVELRPEALQNLTLAKVIESLVIPTLARTKAEIKLDVVEDCPLPEDIKIAFYHIARESLINVTKHAGASEINIQLICDNNEVVMRIADNGQGFNPDHILPGHIGIHIMRERANNIGASLEIESNIGEGTQVILTWSNEEEGKS